MAVTMFLANMTGDHYFSGKNGKPQRDTSEKLLKCVKSLQKMDICARLISVLAEQ